MIPDSTVAYTKSPTTYGNFVEGILDCFSKAGSRSTAAGFINHGTTLVINALIQRRGAGPRWSPRAVSAMFWRSAAATGPTLRPAYRRDEPLVPRAQRFEVTERIDAEGEVLDAARRRTNWSGAGRRERRAASKPWRSSA